MEKSSGKKKRSKVGLKAKTPSEWHRGRLCPIRNPKAMFIKPTKPLPEGYVTKDVFMHSDSVSQFLLPLKNGDELEFILGDRDRTKPMARKVRICQYSSRTWEELDSYTKKFHESMRSSDRNKALVETLPNKAQWRFFGSPLFSEEVRIEKYVKVLFPILEQILIHGKHYKTLLKEMMKNVLQGTLFQKESDEGFPALISSSSLLSVSDFQEFYRDDYRPSLPVQTIRSFCQEVVRHVPEVARCLLPTVFAISEKKPTMPTQRFLYDLLASSLSGENSLVSDVDVWQDLPLIPTSDELAGNLVEKDKHLSPVKTNSSYKSAEDYMDTYFRLLRAETFSAIQHGIKELMSCELDPRDMNVYYNVHLAGFEILNGRFSLAVQFTPAKKVKKWEASPQLMFGNLVCISLNRKFDDVIWATVSNRDTTVLNKSQVIMIELIDDINKSLSVVISSLQAHAGTAVMVESPTYHHALKPVLKSLKAFEMETFPLQKEIVYAKFSAELPSYLENADTLDTSPVYSGSANRNVFQSYDFGGRMDVRLFLETFGSHARTSLEASQCAALLHALKSRLAIVQGPPGCGKTFIGVKIVQLLLSLSPSLTKPILLLTYKNHALDEFLKHMLEFCSKDHLVRIGGRSKEPELESCNLQKIMRNEKCTKALYAEIQETRSEIDQLESDIKEMASVIDSSCHLTQRSLIEELSEEQTQSLLLDAPWGKKLVHKINAKTHANRLRIQQLVSGITNEFRSVQEFLLQCMQSGVPNSHQLCYKLFEKALNTWLPNRTELQRMKQFQSQFVLQFRTTEAGAEQDGSNESGDDNYEEYGGDFDEEYVKELLETRMTSIEKQGEKGKEGLVLFKSDKVKKRLIEVSDYPVDMQVSPHIRSVKNVWGLNEIERMQFLYCILTEKASSISEEFDKLIKQLDELKNRKQELEMQQKVEILSAKKIIGLTITGASINHEILNHIGASVVVVEEAAEILEPSLLAALTPSIEHLILIGDHKQLRPQVDTYELCKSFNFDVSMMERLINNGFPFQILTKQNRMRPEFSKLLLDIYPRLKDNLKLVEKNKPLECIEKSMYFWSHDDPERKDRTYTNAKEADRIVSLVLYLLSGGCLPSEITVLAAYLGQTKLLRNMLKKEKAKRTDLFQEQNSDGRTDGFVQVQTIDMFQGDENKYVIVSLVRSNPQGRIGFLKKLNRRCVAQSRAKCGMYFVGNGDTLLNANESCWRGLIEKMFQEECFGYGIPLQCSKHQALSQCRAVNAQEVTEIVDKPTTLCKCECGDQLPCNIPGHLCQKLCASKHLHDKCSIEVVDMFPKCLHEVKRKCYQKLSQLLCQKNVTVTLKCGHEKETKCYVNKAHIRCKVVVQENLPRCGHSALKECYVDISDVICSHQCREMNSCGTHSCSEICGKPHSHTNCQKMIDYKFPGCDHPSPRKKKCSEIITWKCTTKVFFTGSCGHPIERLCHLKETEVKCPFKPCGKNRKCGHPCRNACGEDCEKGDCKHCEDIQKKKMEEFHKRAEQKVRELEQKITKKAVPTFSRDEIHKDGDTAAEYQRVNDLVTKFIQPCHNWCPTVTKIEKVTNLELEKKFEKAKSKAFGDHVDVKFHGTSDDGVKGITKDGFRMPDQNPPPSKRGMFGQGIYFATDSSKSAQQIYTKGSQKLLLCQVILGKTKTVKKADHTLCKEYLRSQRYDSVYAPRGTGVKNDEFVIFDPDQALPQYVIHFHEANGMPRLPTPTSAKPFFVRRMVANRNVNFADPFEAHYRYAEAHFFKMSIRGQLVTPQPAKISSIDIVINKTLEDKFEKMKQLFRSQGISDKEILAYHGTDPANISNILQNNLQLRYARRQAYGKGNYFSEYPGISLGYGNGLLLCRIIPGKEFVDQSSSNIPQGYNSKKVLLSQPGGAGAANASGEMIIIENSDQILPYFVIYR